MASDPWATWREWAQRAAASFNTQAAGAWPGIASAPGAAPFGPWAASFERFASEARSYLDQIGQAGQVSSSAAAEAARRFGDQLREQFERAAPLWSAFGAPGLGAAQTGGPPAPALGATREHQERAARLLQAWSRTQEAQQRLQRLWSDALREAATAFSSKLATAESRPSATAESLRALYDAWIECAEQAYARIAHGPEFGQAIGDLVNSASAWREEMQASFELWAKTLDLPTRSEINSLNARLTTLESTLRTTSRPAPRPATKPAPTKPARKPKSSKQHSERSR
ncbi:MAG TPA: poly(R)-hydroxyalkanoic acid synthase subunit PhaE [Steroidobacteraceae bacterium]|nr:poly(R)-hydroxyalkanoic acid synthase subunit PhaE [Steroidobacteraceae bacterium]